MIEKGTRSKKDVLSRRGNSTHEIRRDPFQWIIDDNLHRATIRSLSVDLLKPKRGGRANERSSASRDVGRLYRVHQIPHGEDSVHRSAAVQIGRRAVGTFIDGKSHESRQFVIWDPIPCKDNGVYCPLASDAVCAAQHYPFDTFAAHDGVHGGFGENWHAKAVPD
jgi:hypothetical protein